MRQRVHPSRDIESSSLDLPDGKSFSFFVDSSSHSSEEFWPRRRPCPGALGDADAAGCSFGEIGNAFVEVDIPPLDATHHLLVRRDCAGWTQLCTNLAGCAEFVSTEVYKPGGHERHVRGYTCEPDAGAEAWADERSVLAEFAEARGNCRRNE